MKLELKHLAPYLPYGVQFIEYVGYGKIKTLTVMNFERVLSRYNTHVAVAITETKQGPLCNPLLLRPLSDLTKEIEHNENSFIPIEELKRLQREIHKLPEGKIYENLERDLDERIDMIPKEFELLGHSVMFFRTYWLIQKLISWHFDIFNLIENGLAIDMNAITSDV